ncbi:cupin domain-containing protein [Vibrio alginolyticus]|jgi:anti-sigma factor ChrR (cupin superfamily)|uniref:cupin domain-containing protein n=1 Tax=Vibrio alginolyticus TaxID=663 RepID=UPI001C9D461B|nr:cupin domain-containing protein [Vibrio alginolyticus]MBY7682049.1 cupin domain-containing protein [Vibrio alginolyticus]MCR9445467.1 cupin domain-containing protein [Vibrio alginolyticus]MCR9449773.1 cupin domain-containing protein [Vibrio alginolyticus]MCR9456987.1 cupin domain-containing protein [Vibrio alginolyticus]
MLNMDFSKRIVIDTAQQEWIASPSKGVWRKPLEREAKESGHTTSVVKYEPNSQFSTHPHSQGEEILVLEGVFSDEYGDYPAGTYLRNPPGSQHAPFSKEGCVILVKLNQFESEDLETVRINTNQASWQSGVGGLQVMPLHNFEHEHVALVKWPKGEKFQPHRHFGGEEIFVLSGEFRDELGTYPALSWIRSPHMSEHFPFVEQETIIWVKTGHLPLQAPAQHS